MEQVNTFRPAKRSMGNFSGHTPSTDVQALSEGIFVVSWLDGHQF